LTKLIFLLQPRKLPPQFNLIPFLTLLDPDDENKTMVRFRLAFVVFSTIDVHDFLLSHM